MKKLVILMIVVVLTVFVSVAMAHEDGAEKAGRLFLFQKCDASLVGKSGFDSSGCPNVGAGPWLIFPNNDRVGVLQYKVYGERNLTSRLRVVTYYPTRIIH